MYYIDKMCCKNFILVGHKTNSFKSETVTVVYFFIIIIICFVHLEFNIAIGGNFNKSNEYSTSKNWTTQRQKDPNDPRFDINIEISAIIVISFNFAFNTSREKTIDSIL